MKKVLIIISILLGTVSIAQQLPQQSQYMFNQYAFNPAYAGSTDYWEAVMNNRLPMDWYCRCAKNNHYNRSGPF